MEKTLIEKVDTCVSIIMISSLTLIGVSLAAAVIAVLVYWVGCMFGWW